jgi:hypothetical protein
MLITFYPFLWTQGLWFTIFSLLTKPFTMNAKALSDIRHKFHILEYGKQISNVSKAYGGKWLRI